MKFRKTLDVIFEQTLIPDPSKIKVIEKWSIVAFANYYRKHIENFAKMCSPLNKLTRKGVDFQWTELCG